MLDVIHTDIGQLQYRGRTAKDLVDSGIFFYESMYIPDTKGNFGQIVPIPLPSFESDEWIAPAATVSESFRCKIYNDVKNSLKMSTGSKTVRLSWFISLNIFVDFFSSVNVHKTPTMFVCKNLSDSLLSELMDEGWDKRSDGEIECRIKMSSMCFRYQIEKQMLSLCFHYQRWKKNKGKWVPLDQDLEASGHSKRKNIEIIYNDAVLTCVEVEEDWSLNYIRWELLLLQDDVLSDFRFIFNGKLVSNCKHSIFYE